MIEFLGDFKMANTGIPLDICYGSLSLFTTILHNIFLLYHVDMFVSFYKIDKLSFWIGESIFLVWNSLNDPLFGWLSDRQYLSPQPTAFSFKSNEPYSKTNTGSSSSSKEENLYTYNKSKYSEKTFPSSYSNYSKISNRQSNQELLQSEPNSINASIISHRLNSLAWNGPLFAISFALFWVSWLSPGLQFVVCLCLYDSFLTSVDLQHNALLADLAISADVRTRLNACSAIFSAFGSVSVFVSYAVWHRENLVSFRAFCLFLSVLSILGFYVGIRLLRTAAIPLCSKTSSVTVENTQSKLSSSLNYLRHFGSCSKSSTDDLKNYIRQLTTHQNFIWFALMNLIQVFHCHFNSNFFPLFLDVILGKNGNSLGALLLGVSFVFPHINNLYFLSLCRRHGVYRVVLLMFVMKFLLTLTMCGIGSNCIWAICIYIASNRVFTEGTCKLLNLVVSDLVDEDCVIHSRHQPVSALIFGTVALLSKPGQTLAPLLGTWMLSWQTGHELFTAASSEVRSSDLSSDPKHRIACFNLLVYIPMVCATFQMLIWLLKFRLHGHRLHWIKAVRSGSSSLAV
ncbi:transmembrane protein 180 [Octopus sinensis]|uniref:Transmembrane protein 180 n=1 Tax=Octopus sinensis TaxID=2607531 RepID=A0A6P7T662_9MOLL|nr:transmembrane protein 180 [Octopus sinensis]XP_036365079.1 transmembrane protein 180 [Octopus sinensis]